MKTTLFALSMTMLLAGSAPAEDFYLADVNTFPGQLWLSEGGTAERSILRRAGRADPAFPRAVTKLGQVAVGPDGKVYYASSLDGSVLHLLDGRNEVLSFEFDGQIRDLSTSGEEHTVYFSVVPTPQNGEPLADGKIYRRDIYEGQPTEVATIRQADVGHAWWGTFTIRDGAIYLATYGDRSRIYRQTSTGPELAFEARSNIQGFTAGGDGDFYFTIGDRNVYRTRDFENVETVLRAERRLTEVSLRASSESGRP